MKQTHTIICIVLIIAVLSGWFFAVTGIGDSATNEYNAHIAMAEDYLQRGLFQKAIAEYEKALEIKESVEVWAATLNAYKARMAENAEIYEDYLDAASGAVSSYGDNIDFVMAQVELYLSEDEINDAFGVLQGAVDEGVTDEAVLTLYKDIKYQFDFRRGDYTDIEPCVNGYYRVMRAGLWDYMEPDGTFTGLNNVTVLGPAGDDIRIWNEGDRIVMFDDDNVVQGILPKKTEEIGVFEDGRIPVKVQGTYAYYDILGDKLYGDYQMAGAYTDEIAAVQQEDSWYFIDTDGKPISEATYEDIILNIDGSALKDDVFAAKTGGSYHLFNNEEEQIGSFSCEEMDVITEDGLIAFCRNGKWGYVDSEGNEYIAPIYEEARSFSNGMAAVYDGQLWGFIDTTGYLAIPCQFKDVDYFTETGTCMVIVEGDVWQQLRLRVTQ